MNMTTIMITSNRGSLSSLFAVVALAFSLIPTTGKSAVNTSGIEVFGSVDLVGKYGDAGTLSSDRFEVREAEFSVFGPIDPKFDGILSPAAHQEGGEAFFEIHEAAISSSRLIPRTRFKVGQYFLGIGRLNQIHRHDWPFISTPKAQVEFFDEEGVLDTGLEVSYLTPLPFYLDLTIGVTAGRNFGHSHSEGENPFFPTHYGRLATYFDLWSEGGMQWGWNYLGRKPQTGTWMTLLGSDIVAKWKEGKRLRFLFQKEVWYKILTPRSGTTTESLGGYAYPEVGLSESFSFGTRFDYYTILSLANILGDKIDNWTFNIVPTLTWHSSEFAKTRVAFHHEFQTQAGTTTSKDQAVEFQLTFILGAHPAHDF